MPREEEKVDSANMWKSDKRQSWILEPNEIENQILSNSNSVLKEDKLETDNIQNDDVDLEPS